MRPSQIRKALDDYAARQLPDAPDVWPAVRREILARRPPGERIHIEALGRRRSALPAALLVLLLIAAVALASWLNGGGGPAPAATPSPAESALPGAATALPAPLPATVDSAYLADLLAHNLGARLGRDPAQLDAAIQAATLDTIDQAVRDGQLTPAQAAQAKTRASQGLIAFFRDGFAGSGAGLSSDGVRALSDYLGLGSDAATPAADSSAK